MDKLPNSNYHCLANTKHTAKGRYFKKKVFICYSACAKCSKINAAIRRFNGLPLSTARYATGQQAYNNLEISEAFV